MPKISEHQHGFLPHRSCEEAVQALIEYIEASEDPTFAVFVDFRSAFDNVNRKRLMNTVSEKYNIRGKILRTLETILRPNSLIIDNGYELSEPIQQQKGIIQGDSVSPFLFIMFVNSLLERLERRKVLAKMFADDLVIAAQDADELQMALNAVSIWSQENGMAVNTDKTKAVKFRKAGPLGKRKLYMNKAPIEFVPNFKYLGITVQPALGFGDHVEQILCRTAKIIVCLGNLQRLPVDLAIKVFEIKVMPIVIYGMAVIAPKLAKTNMLKLDRCKSMYLKAVLGLSRHTSTPVRTSTGEREDSMRGLEEQRLFIQFME